MDKKIYELIFIGIICLLIITSLFIGNLVMSISTKRLNNIRDVENTKRLDKLSEQISEMKNIVKTDVKKILDGFKQLLKNDNK